jgi:hypothetical protein
VESNTEVRNQIIIKKESVLENLGRRDIENYRVIMIKEKGRNTNLWQLRTFLLAEDNASSLLSVLNIPELENCCPMPKFFLQMYSLVQL